MDKEAVTCFKNSKKEKKRKGSVEKICLCVERCLKDRVDLPALGRLAKMQCDFSSLGFEGNQMRSSLKWTPGYFARITS